MIDARPSERHGPRPPRRGLVALLLATALATCTHDHPTGPRMVGRGFLRVRPVLVAPASLASFGLTIDSLRVAIIRPPTAIVRDTTVFFNPDISVLRLLLPVSLQAATETFTVVIELRAGTSVLYSDTTTARVSVGVTDSSSVAGDTLRYVGPGSTVKHLVITPSDSVVTLGGSQRFRATATDVNGAPVDSFFVSWSSSDTVTAPISRSGLLQAPGKRGKVFVRAVTPTSVYDSTPVTFIPVPAALLAISGGGQTGGATAKLALPLRARVTASDTMGVKGIAVQFQATSGGGSVRDPVVLSDSLGFAEDTVTLGATFGAQAFQASVTGLPSVTFGATATGVTIHSADITGDSVWSAALSPHVVTRYLRIVNGGTLTIQAGAVVKFDPGAGLQVGDTTPSVNQPGGLKLDGTGPGITLTANSATPTPGFWKGIEVQRSIAAPPWRRTLIEWAGGARTPFGTLASEACILFVNQSGAEVDLDSLRIRQCSQAGVRHFGGVSHIHRSEVDSVTGPGIHADLAVTLQLDSNTVRGSGLEGLRISSSLTHLSPSRFNRFLGNGSAIQMEGVQLPGLLRQDSIAGNTNDFIRVLGGQPGGLPDTTATAFTIFAQPQRAGSNGYLVTGLLDVGRVGGQTVTLDSNLVLRFNAQSGLLIGDSSGTRSGSIVSLGTNRTNAPRLTSASLSPAAGDWYGLEIGRLSVNTRLANVRVEFAGDSIGGRSKHRFGLLVRSPAAQTLALDSVVVVQSGRAGSDTNAAGIGVLGSGSGVDVRRSVAQGNRGFGIVVSGVPGVKLVGDTANGNTVGFALFTDNFGTSAVAPGDSVSGNVATANTLYPLQLDIQRLPVLQATNTFTGNIRDTALLIAGRVTFSGTLPRFTGVPWHVTAGPIDIDSGGVLTIAAGNTLAFDSTSGIIVGSNAAAAALAAVGTAPLPILLTASYTPGLSRRGWAGVEWRNPAASGNSFTFVTVDRAGYVFQPQCDCSQIQVGALRSVDTSLAINTNLTFDHLTVRGAFAFAIDFRRNGTGTLTITNSQLYNNGAFDPMIRAFINQPNQLTISGSDLYHYRGWIIQASDTVNAVGNWWGDVAGLDSGYQGQDSLGRGALQFNPVKFTPVQTTPFFPVGSAVGLVQTADSALSPGLSTSVPIHVRAIDAVGRGVTGGTVSWSVSPLTSILPPSGAVDAGGRADATWTFTNSAGTKIATASGIGTPTQYVAAVQPGATVSTSWTLLSSPLSQGTVTAPKAITFTSTNRRGVLITKAVDQFNNPTQPFYCTAQAGFGCVGFSYATIDSIHTSGGTNGDSVFFHAIVTNPAQFVLRGQYNTASGLAFDSVTITMNAAVAGVKIDRDPNIGGVQATPDTVRISSLCPTGPGNFACQGTYNAFLVDSGLSPLPSGNAVFGWNLVAGPAVTFDSQTAVFPHDIAFVTARANGFARIAVKDVSGNNFGTDTLPILVQQIPAQVLVSPDTVSVLVGGTTTFHAAVVDQAGDTMATPIHWRRDQPFTYHLTIIDTSVANQAKVRLDSTPFGEEFVDAFAVRGPGDTLFAFAGLINPVLQPLNAGGRPEGIAVNSATNRVYVANGQSSDATVLDGTTGNVLQPITIGISIRVGVDPGLSRVYFTGTVPGAGLTIVDGSTNQVIKTLDVGTAPSGVAVDTVGHRVWVVTRVGAAAPQPVLVSVNGTTDALGPDTIALPDTASSAVFNPANGLVYLTSTGASGQDSTVFVVNPNTKALVTTLVIGHTPEAVALNALTNQVYTTNLGNFGLKVIDGNSNTVIDSIPVQFGAEGVAVDQAANRIYVASGYGAYLTVIDGVKRSILGVLSLKGVFTVTDTDGIGLVPSAGRLYVSDATGNVIRLKF